MTVAWTTPANVVAALGGQGAAPAVDDAYLAQCVAAANDAAFRKRREAGYVDDAADDAAAPSSDVALGATLWAVALWRERSSTDGHNSFEEFAGFHPTGGSWPAIKRLLAIGRARVDYPAAGVEGALLERFRRRRLLRRGFR